jgi:histidine triad (HIT) family protein
MVLDNLSMLPNSEVIGLIENQCPFCKMVRGEVNPVKVYEDTKILSIMDLYPATPGHMLVLPKKHIESIYTMPDDLGTHLMRVAIKISKAVKSQFSPDGLNLIQANETAAGQTIPHFHLHIVPRYKNDAVILRFGHGDVPADLNELERLATKVRSALGIT